MEYQKQSNIEVQKFKKENLKTMLYHKYVQWQIDRQLKKVADEARKSGMSVGLYHDIAIGSVDGGNDAWNYQDVLAEDADVGAPPDDFSPEGQNWGFSPQIPEKMKETAYELFIQTMRKNMKYCGALRIDHALGMFRLFWIPRGMHPKDGAYVKYPSEDLLRIIALESVRNKTIIIAEDLGTIGENVREILRQFQMLSYKLFYFERNYPDPSFVKPDQYPEIALCAVTTHDLPTLYGYWEGQDIMARKQLGKYNDDAIFLKQVNERERDKALILSALKSQNILPEEYPSVPEMIPQMTTELCLAVYRYLALTPSKLLSVSLDDITGVLNQQNMPGTIDAYPNWTQKTPITLEQMISDKRFLDLSEMLKKYRL
jgi:4-alpha-glucanotransferase